MPRKKQELVKIDFNKPHVTYRDKKGNALVGTTTALKELAMPALVGWGFNMGKQPMYENIDEAIKGEGIDLDIETLVDLDTPEFKARMNEIVVSFFSAGQKRKNESLYTKVDKACVIGTVAHAILNARDKGYKLDPSNILPDVLKMAGECVKSYDSWASGARINTIFTERELVSERFGYGGTIDKYCGFNDALTLLDYKTGSGIYESYFFQLAAYVELLIENGCPVEKVLIVILPKTQGDDFTVKQMGVEKLMRFYFPVFIKSVGIYYDRKEIKRIEKTIFA